MKRILTFVLSLLVLTFSVHPIVSLHFCGDELKSLNISVLSNDNVCCIPTKTVSSANVRFPILKLGESESSCCITTNVEVVTDSFIFNSSQSNQSPGETSFMPGWFTPNFLVDLASPNTTVKPKLNFPTQGFYIKTLDFLSIICVYRN